jgi:hypothetical protein
MKKSATAASSDIANYNRLEQHDLNMVEEGLRELAPSSCEISFPAAPQHGLYSFIP